MKRRFLLLLFLSLAVGGLAWLALYWFSAYVEHTAPLSPQELAKASARMHPDVPAQPTVQPEPALDPSRRVRLAIGWLGLPDETQNGQVSDLLAAELSDAKGLELVDRQSLDKVLRELELSLSGLVRAKEAVRVGKLLRADWFLLGSRTPAGATNALIARIVDARSGVIRDIGVFPGDGASPALAAQLAQFVRHYRQPGAHTKPRVFLAVGAFQDLSVNSRQADFPVQLRAQLLEAYRGSDVTLLERESVNALLQEVHLDLASLTDSAPDTTRPTLQSAFWLVDGYYQSYETADLQVELGLTIRQIFGRSTSAVLREKPGQALVRKVKASIDQPLAASATTPAPTRVSEALAQLRAGRRLLFPNSNNMFDEMLLVQPPQYEGEKARARRNLEEAAQAFQTVLLLEPTNREAKVCLALTLRGSPLDQLDEARQYYRQVLAEPVQDKWTRVAQDGLLDSLYWASPQEKLKWLQPFASSATNPSNAFVQREYNHVARDQAIQQGDSAQAQSLAESRLLDTIASFGAGRIYEDSLGMDRFAKTFGKDQAAAARRLVGLYPEMKARAPDAEPYLLASIVSFQVDTNTPVIAQFEQALQTWVDHPEKLPQKITPFAHHLDIAYHWAQAHHFERLANEIREAQLRAWGAKPGATTAEIVAVLRSAGPVFGDMRAMELAFAHKAAHRWQEALAVFECYSNEPVQMGTRGPWGEAYTMILSSKEVAQCRKQLGLPVEQDPREFNLGKSVLCLHGIDDPSAMGNPTKYGAFVASPDGLWIAYLGKLLQLNFTLKTNRVIALPISSQTIIHCLCLTPTELWVGTGGEGLVGYDLTTGQCEHLTQRDGLLLDSIYALHATADTLWLGYGQGDNGGLGKLDLQTRRLTSFTPSLLAHPAKGVQQPPRVPVGALASGTGGDVWFIANALLGRYRSQTEQWEFLPAQSYAAALAGTPEHLFVGRGCTECFNNPPPKGLGISTFSLKDEQWKTFSTVPGLPSQTVTTVTVDGRYLWVGGKGYIALLDPTQDKVLKFAYIHSSTVDRLQVGGGYLWAQFDWHLYRAPLPSLP